MKEEPDNYRVLFVRERAIPSNIEPGVIVIAPSPDRWNDFGYRILIDIVVQPHGLEELDKERLKLSGFFAFLDPQSGRIDARHLSDLVDQSPDRPVDATGVPSYFTMLPDMASYRRIVDYLGTAKARDVLRAINDIVEADDMPAGKLWLRTARESEVFLNAFLRQSQPYFVWKNAAPILRGVEHEERNRISEGIRIRFQLAGRPMNTTSSFAFRTPARSCRNASQ